MFKENLAINKTVFDIHVARLTLRKYAHTGLTCIDEITCNA